MGKVIKKKAILISFDIAIFSLKNYYFLPKIMILYISKNDFCRNSSHFSATATLYIKLCPIKRTELAFLKFCEKC